MKFLTQFRTTWTMFRFGIICYMIFLICIIKYHLSKPSLFNRVANLKIQKYTGNFTGQEQLEKQIYDKEILLDDVDNVVFFEEQITVTETELRNYLEEHCDEKNDFTHVLLDGDQDIIMSMEDYKRSYAYNYTKKYSDAFIKREIPPTLSPTLKPGLNPEDGLASRYLVLDADKINKELKEEKNQRLIKGDEDALKIPEVKKEMEESILKIPNIVHFVWFGSNDFLVHNYMAVVGAWRYQRPAVILFHCDEEPVSVYWKAAKEKCAATLKIVKRTPPLRIHRNYLQLTEHRSDVVRLQILMEIGGIYLDTDSVVLKSLNVFRDHEMVIGQPHRQYAAENAIMFAHKDAWFLKRWYHEYRNYKRNSWGFNSLEVPGSIAHFYPNTVHVTFTELCRPHWQEIKMIYGNVFDWEPIYVMHLYQRDLAYRDGQPERPLKQLAVLNTTYGEVARHVIWGDKRIRDVTDWLVTCNLGMRLEV